ncbi:GON-4-like protein [Pteropus alecto]|uniref:GON-4-like protein n=1 Tax=Pteropus alecto TaxID=9402 RepID=L5JWB0_PTEAL|nr:GON-4-like protein [Pteropus alecto]
MVPSKKRRPAVTESPQHQGIQEEGDLDLEWADKPGSEQVESLGSSSLPQGLEAPSVQDAAYPLGVEAPSLSSGLLTQDAGVPVPEAVGVAVPKGSALASPESSRPRDTHTGKENLQAAGAKRGKKMTLRPRLVPQEDRSDPPVTKEPFPGEPGEDVQGEGELRGVFRLRFSVGSGLPWPPLSLLRALPLRAPSGLTGTGWVWDRVSGGLREWGDFLPPPQPSNPRLGSSLSFLRSRQVWGGVTVYGLLWRGGSVQWGLRRRAAAWGEAAAGDIGKGSTGMTTLRTEG